MSIDDTWMFWGHKSIIDLPEVFYELELREQRLAREMYKQGKSVIWLLIIVYIKVTKSQSDKSEKDISWLTRPIN